MSAVHHPKRHRSRYSMPHRSGPHGRIEGAPVHVMPQRILLQTTLPTLEDDWSIWRFSLLEQYLKTRLDAAGEPLCVVTARDRQPDDNGDDPVLSRLSRNDFDQLWLFALDVGDGLSAADMAGILHFHESGGGLLTTRDHQDMGLSMVALGLLGQFHHFHSQNLDPDTSRCDPDDTFSPSISFPNYHSGRNGDYQTITPTEPLHPLLKRPDGTPLQFFPAHPHEGSVAAPSQAPEARLIATGVSLVSGRDFNLVVVGDRPKTTPAPGRVVAQSTFHHFVDYNWDIDQGCPSFVDEPPGDGMKQNPQALADIHTYVSNLVMWLAPEEAGS